MKNLKVFKNSKVVVTGHTGFKGSWLTAWLKLLGANVMGISLNPPTTPSHFKVSKINKKSPLNLANQLILLIKNEDPHIENITVAKPGFINIKFKTSFWNNFAEEILNNHESFGVNVKDKKKKYLIEFVSANPTGPLHVGHCRGAILGDVISNILLFNKHLVSKEYYVNDYGNQIINFTKSVYLRIREILNKEKFPMNDPNLYPGDYLIEIANNIINENKTLKFDVFEVILKELTKLSVEQSLKMIKINLNNLGIVHDNFTSETILLIITKLKKLLINLQSLTLSILERLKLLKMKKIKSG